MQVQTRIENTNAVESPKDIIEINSNKRNTSINLPKNNSFPEKPLFERGIEVLINIGENEGISGGEKLKSMECKFPTILKVIVGIFTIGIGAAIMHKIEEKYSNEDLSARKGIANGLEKLGHAIKQLKNGESKKIEFCGVEIEVGNKEDEKFSIKKGENKFEVSKKSLENNIAKNIDLLNKESGLEFINDSMLNVAKDIDQFKTKDAGEPKKEEEGSEEEYNKRKEECSKKEKRFEELTNKILESSANTKLENFNAKNTSKETIYRFVKRVVTEKAKSKEEVEEKFYEAILIGSNDAREIREKFEKANKEAKDKVKIGKTEKKSSEKVEDASLDGINKVNKVDINQEQNKTTPQDVHNFVADIILNDDAFTHDQNVLKPGERLRQTLIKHSGTITALLNDKDKKLLDTIDDEIRSTIESSLNEIREKYNKTYVLVNGVKSFLEGKNPETFSKMEKEIDNAVENAANQMQDSLSEQLKSICGGGTNENQKVIEEIDKKIGCLKGLYSKEAILGLEKKRKRIFPMKIEKFLENVYEEFCEISYLCTQSKNPEYINDKLKKLNDRMYYLSYYRDRRDVDVKDEDLIKEGEAIFLDIKRCLLEDKLENALSCLEKDGKNTYESKNKKLIGIPKIIEDLKSGKEVTSDMIKGTGDYGPNDGNIDLTSLKEDLKREISILNVKINNLETLMAQSGTDLNSDGYGKFMQKVMGRYMKEIPLIDKRSMVAAGIRYYQKSKLPVKPKEGDKDYEKQKEEYEAFEAKEASRKFGATLKGAGPIMQKMLQGLKTGNEEFNVAIEDMKSKLAQINEEMIKAYLSDVIERSNNKIESITVERSLGSASVGQALLCSIKYSGDNDKGNNNEGKKCVVKLLRPDVYNRAMREKEIFEQASKEIPGMEITFNGQLKSIMDELDLTKEAKNIEYGKVYDKEHDNVKSMKIITPPIPTKNVLILEEAPGKTIDSHLNKEENGSVCGEIEKCIKNENTKDLKKLFKGLINSQKALITLSKKWVTEGVYKDGFYHGDLHAGNIMIEPSENNEETKLTVIDFGNATKLTKDQQSNIMLMMASASVGDEELFMNGFRELLTENGKKDWDNNKDVLKRIFKEVLSKEDEKSTGERIAVALTEAQKQGIEIPAPIFKFSQCQIRLSNTINSMNKAIEDINKKIEKKRLKLKLDDKTKEYLKKPDDFFECMSDVITENRLSSLSKIGVMNSYRIMSKIK